MIEPEIQDGLRALGKTQELFAGTAVPPSVPNPNDVSWYGTSLSGLRGAFGFVREGEDLGDFVGEFLEITSARNPEQKVVVYILGEYPGLDSPIAITRRAFVQIEVLNETPTSAYVELIR